MRNHIIGGLALILGAAVMPMTAEALNPTTVTCPGDSIQVAIDSGFDEITVNGTCTENVLIRQDDITIMGDGGDDNIAGQVSIDAARRVTIQELTISDSPDRGVVAVNSSSVTIRNVVINNVPGDGVLLTGNSAGVLENVSISDAGGGVTAASGAQLTVANSMIEEIDSNGATVADDGSLVLSQTTIRNANTGVAAFGNVYIEVSGSMISDNVDCGICLHRGADGFLTNSTVENNGGRGVVLDNSCSTIGGPLTIAGNGGDGLLVVQGSTAALSQLTIQSNGGPGIAVDLNSSGNFDNSTIQDNGGDGLLVVEGSTAALSQSMIQNNGGIGIAINGGSYGTVSNSTIQDNGDDGSVGVLVSYSSTAHLEGNAILGKAAGVNLDFSSSVFLANNQITATTSDDATLDMSQGSVARLAGGNVLNASPNGFSIFLQQGSTLMQRSERDTANGPVYIRSESNVELRNIEITGNVIVEDHSLLRLRDLAGDSHVTVRGNTTVSLDSGLNFIGSNPVKVVGDISCLDQESSLSKGTLSHTGKIKPGCTGY